MIRFLILKLQNAKVGFNTLRWAGAGLGRASIFSQTFSPIFSLAFSLAAGLAISAGLGCASTIDRGTHASGGAIANREPSEVPTTGAVDPYIWLENSTDPAVQAWAKGQSSKAVSALEGDPRFNGLTTEIRKIAGATDRIPKVSLEGGMVRNLWNDEAHLRGLWRQTTAESFKAANPNWDVLLDVDDLNKQESKSWVFSGAHCLPPKANLCLISLSDAGRDEVEVREFDVSKKAFVKDGFLVPAAKTNVSWVDADTVIIGSDFGPGTTTTSGYARQLKTWKRGQLLSDAKLLFEGQVNDLSVQATVTARPESSNIYLSQAPSFFTNKNYLLDKAGKQQLLPFPDDANFLGEFKGTLLATLRSDIKVGDQTFKAGSLISLPLANAFQADALKSMQVVFGPNPQSVFAEMVMTRDHLLISILNNIKGELWAYSPSAKGWTKSQVKIPANGAINILPSDEFDAENRFYAGYETFNVPSSLYFGLAGATAAPQVVKQLGAKFNASNIVFEQFMSTSLDGTKIPYFVVHKKGYKLNAKNPTLLYAYGGFEDSMLPFYMRSTGKVWLEKGGVWVLANIRGGGEFGPSWHSTVIKKNRQLVYQDFASVAKDLFKRKITSPRRLGIQGGSNGGLLMGVAETQHPEYYHAVIAESALLDMIRYTKLPPGASWIGEYGDPDDPAMAAYILTYSPYQNVKQGVKYPKTFFHISSADDRVQPGHSRKMAARMEQFGNDVLLFENTEGGHGGAADIEQSVRKSAMEYTFLYQQLMD